VSVTWPKVKFSEFLKPNSRPYTLGPDEDANLVGMRLYGAGPFHRELKPAMRIAKKSHFVIKAGDVIYNKLFAWKGTFGIIPPELDGMFVSDKFPTYELDRTRVDQEFLAWYFRCRSLWEEAQGMSTGSAALSKLTLNPPKFLLLTMPLPLLSEQCKTVVRIKELYNSIIEAHRLRNLAINESKTCLETCLQELMGKFERLDHFEKVITFKPRSGPSFLTTSTGIGTPILMPSSVTGFGVNPTKIEYPMHLIKLGEKDSLLAGDILMARGNKRDQVGNAGVVPPECEGWTYANLLMRLQVDKTKVIPEFCVYWLRSPQTRKIIYNEMSGTNPNIQKINQQKILRLPFPIGIHLSDQRRAVDKLDELQSHTDGLKQMQTETAAELDALLPSILDKAFKGELR
jgi:type I restriction enzyme S subunit